MRTIAWLTVSLVWIGACGHTAAETAEKEEPASSRPWPERTAELARQHGLDEPADPVPVHDPDCPAPPAVAHDEPGDCLEGWTCPVHGDALERSGALDGVKAPMKQSAYAYRCRSGAHVWVRTHGRLNVGRIVSRWYGPWPLGG